MLLYLSVTNFRSFGYEAVLDMQQRRFKTQHPRPGESWADNTYRRAAIFGANAAGKSNILKAIGLLNHAVTGSLRSETFAQALRNPHALRADEHTAFEVEYVKEDIRYRWGIALDEDGIVEEYLDANPSSRWRKVFQRDRDQISFGNNIGLSHAAKENIEEFIQPWALALSAFGTVRSAGKFEGALSWWDNLLPLIVSSDVDRDTRHRWLINLAQQNPHWMSVLRMVVRVADVGIRDIGLEELAPLSVHKYFLSINESGSADLAKAPNSREITEVLRYLLFKHDSQGRDFSLSEHEESQGTRSWIDLVIPAIYALAVGGVMAIDELDASLHPMLVRELVSYFNSDELNPLGAQLLFSTHDVTLLGKYPVESLNRGEVWFVEKRHSFSELIALDEFPVRTAHNIEKRYLEGQFGAIPIATHQDLAYTLQKLQSSFTSINKTKHPGE